MRWTIRSLKYNLDKNQTFHILNVAENEPEYNCSSLRLIEHNLRCKTFPICQPTSVDNTVV